MRVPTLLVAILWTRVAVAQPPVEYPVEDVDRPLLLFDGMTEVVGDVVAEKRGYIAVDANGNSTTTIIGPIVDIAAAARHEFDSFEFYAGGSTNVHDDVIRDYTSVDVRARMALGSLRRRDLR